MKSQRINPRPGKSQRSSAQVSRSFRALRAATLLVGLLSSACTKGPSGSGAREQTGWFGDQNGESRVLHPGTSGASEVFSLAGGTLNCILTIAPVTNDNSASYEPGAGQLMGTVSGSLVCNGLEEVPFYDSSVPNRNRFDRFGVIVDLNRIVHQYGQAGASVDVTLYPDCPSTGCPGPGAGSGSVLGSGSVATGAEQPGFFSGVRSDLSAQWIASPGAAEFSVALPGLGTKSCWVYVTAVSHVDLGPQYDSESPVAGEVYCEPWAPVPFSLPVPSSGSSTFSAAAAGGPPVRLTFWGTSGAPPQVNVSVAAECPANGCSAAPALVDYGNAVTVVPVTASTVTQSAGNTVFDPARHWYLCQDESLAFGNFCTRQGKSCIRDASDGSGINFRCLDDSQLSSLAPNQHTFRECALGGGAFGWQYRDSATGRWFPCQAPGNTTGECRWVFDQLADILGSRGVSVALLPAAAQQQIAACNPSASTASPTPWAIGGANPRATNSAASPVATPPTYAASNLATSTAPPAEQSLCQRACAVGSSCVFAVDFPALGVASVQAQQSAQSIAPQCLTDRDLAERFQTLGGRSSLSLAYRQCRPAGATGWCGVSGVLRAGTPSTGQACTRVRPGTPTYFGLRRAGIALPDC
ncbi:MAG: hypothetical protein IPL40_11975 [Proteobacteria bacterium]|nr:hypothetical protein [Pseudomonadota bacterium]